jgi:hypothetical protein
LSVRAVIDAGDKEKYVQKEQEVGRNAPSATSENEIELHITRTEFEDAIVDFTDLVEATVFHTLQQWLAAQRRIASAQAHSPNQLHQDDSCSELTLLEEEEKGFITVVDSSDKGSKHLQRIPTGGTTAPAAGNEKVEIIDTIEEIVLVGGSSRVPAVRAAIRRACTALGIRSFSSSRKEGGQNKEFCTSLNPEHIVAEGLAIRGAVLSGQVSSSKLRGLLMMDCLPNAIGVMSWEDNNANANDSNSISSSNKDQHHTDKGKSGVPAAAVAVSGHAVRCFDAVLRRGMPLPACASMRFALDNSSVQKFVSLDIYEEVEECRLIAPSLSPSPCVPVPMPGMGATVTSSAAASSAAAVPRSRQPAFETVYTYHLMATADVPVPAPPGDDVHRESGESAEHAAQSGENQMVDVQFKTDGDGLLKFEVFRVTPGEQTDDGNLAQSDEVSVSGARRSGSRGKGGGGETAVKKDEEITVFLLGVYGAALLVLYVLAKMLLKPVPLEYL